jgi:hypothetical protein
MADTPNESNLDPGQQLILQMYRKILNLPPGTQLGSPAAPVAPVASTPPVDSGTSILQRLKERILGPMTQGLGNAVSAGIPAIPAYKLYQQLVGQPFTKNVVDPMASDIQYVLTGQGPEGQAPSAPEPDVTPPPTSIPVPKPTIPLQRPAPKAPTGEQIGTPQWQSSPGQGVAPEDVPPETPEAPTPAETPVATAPASAAEMPDFNKLVQPWKPKTDYEKSIMDIFNSTIPKWEDLPKAKSIEPGTPAEAFTRFVRDVGLSLLHKDIFAMKKAEGVEAEAKASQERNYIIQRAAQLANFKLSALSEKSRREEADRESSAKWLEYIGNSNPEYRKNPSYQAAVASIRGIPADQAASLLQSMVDPKTGKLEGMYEDPGERLVKQQETLNNWSIKKLTDAGFTKERAAFSLATGNMDMGAYLMNRYQNAMTSKDAKTAGQAKQDMQEYQKMMTFDPEEAKAKIFLDNFPLAKKAFADNTSANQMRDWATTYLFLGKDAAKKLKVPIDKEVKLNEQVAQLAVSSLGNPEKAKAFTEKFGMSPQMAFQIHYGIKEGAAPSTDMPEPYYTGTKMFPNTAKDPGKYMGPDPLGESIKSAARDQIVNKYRPWLNQIMQAEIITDPKERATAIKNMQKKPLTDDEIYRFATAANQKNQSLLQEVIHQIYAERGITFKP